MNKDEMTTKAGEPERPPRGKPYLSAATGRHAGRLYPIEPGAPRLLGRSAECNPRFPDSDRVSKIHAEIGAQADGSAWLRDMSLNGTSVAGSIVRGERVALRHGDWIVVGAQDDALRVEWLSDAEVQVRILPFVDPLTGVATRRHLESRLADALDSAEDLAAPMSLLMLDVDHFGRFNKSHGQTTGDAVLRGVATCLRATVRELHAAGDTGRLGGDEFFVLLPHCPLEQAVAIASELRRRLALLDLERDGRRLKITGAVGVATCVPHHGMTLDDLVAVVNPHVIRAKNLGRDRACWPGDGAEASPGA